MIEVRELLAAAELRAMDGGDGRTIMGWASRFNEPLDLGVFTETVLPGAFARTISQRMGKIRFLAGHDSGELPLGAITLLEERAEGLWLEARVSATARGRDVLELVRDGAPLGLSIGFSVPSGGDDWSADMRTRTIREAALFEVSAVGAPAADNAEVVAMRALPALLTSAANVRAGKVLSEKNMSAIKAALDSLREVLASAGYGMDDDEPDDDQLVERVAIDPDRLAALAAKAQSIIAA